MAFTRDGRRLFGWRAPTAPGGLPAVEAWELADASAFQLPGAVQHASVICGLSQDGNTVMTLEPQNDVGALVFTTSTSRRVVAVPQSPPLTTQWYLSVTRDLDHAVLYDTRTMRLRAFELNRSDAAAELWARPVQGLVGQTLVSDDGKQVALAAPDSPVLRVFAMSSGAERQSVTLNASPSFLVWGAADRLLAAAGTALAMWHYDPATGARQAWVKGGALRAMAAVCWSRDGQRLTASGQRLTSWGFSGETTPQMMQPWLRPGLLSPDGQRLLCFDRQWTAPIS